MRIRLSRKEKQVLRIIASVGYCPGVYPLHTFNACVVSLEYHGLVQSAKEEGGGVADVRLTTFCKEYMAVNPRLCNPFRWDIAGAVAGLLAAIASIVALFVACSIISK